MLPVSVSVFALALYQQGGKHKLTPKRPCTTANLQKHYKYNVDRKCFAVCEHTHTQRGLCYLEDLLGCEEMFVVNQLLQIYELVQVLLSLLWITDQNFQLFNQLREKKKDLLSNTRMQVIVNVHLHF